MDHLHEAMNRTAAADIENLKEMWPRVETEDGRKLKDPGDWAILGLWVPAIGSIDLDVPELGELLPWGRHTHIHYRWQRPKSKVGEVVEVIRCATDPGGTPWTGRSGLEGVQWEWTVRYGADTKRFSGRYDQEWTVGDFELVHHALWTMVNSWHANQTGTIRRRFPQH
jgi:hypothetical protein